MPYRYIYLKHFRPLCEQHQISTCRPWDQLPRQQPVRLVDGLSGQVLGTCELTYWSQPVIVLDPDPAALEQWDHLLASVPHSKGD